MTGNKDYILQEVVPRRQKKETNKREQIRAAIENQNKKSKNQKRRKQKSIHINYTDNLVLCEDDIIQTMFGFFLRL